MLEKDCNKLKVVAYGCLQIASSIVKIYINNYANGNQSTLRNQRGEALWKEDIFVSYRKSETKLSVTSSTDRFFLPLQSLAHFLCKCTGIIQTIGFWLHRWQKKWIFSSFDQTWPILNGLIIRLWKSGTSLGNPSFDGSVSSVGYPVRSMPCLWSSSQGFGSRWCYDGLTKGQNRGSTWPGHGPAKVIIMVMVWFWF